jgi:hypothetical protein
MKLEKRSEIFKFFSPIGEPEIDYRENQYLIERLVRENGEVVWFGLNTNWVRTPEGQWTKLGTDETVEPLEIYYDANGDVDGYLYPEERNKFFPCDPPIYEKLYQEKYRDRSSE